MADESPTTAVSIITDLTMPAKTREKLARGRGDIVFQSDLVTELRPLVDAQLQLASMLDELDLKANAIARGVVEVNEASTDAILALQQRCADLEGRTFRGRLRRLGTWVDRSVMRLVEALDGGSTNTDTEA